MLSSLPTASSRTWFALLAFALTNAAIGSVQGTDPGECFATIEPGAPVVSDNCPGVTVVGLRSDGKALTDPYPVGTTTITWTATDASGNAASCQQKIAVHDLEKPTIKCPPDLAVSTDPSTCTALVEPGIPTVSDNCPGVTATGGRSDGLPLDQPYPAGTTTITWTAADASGNSASCQQTITVKDVDPPTISCPENIAVAASPGDCAAKVDPGKPAVSDECTDATVSGVRSDGKALTDPYPVGVTTITWTVTDTNGNKNSCEQKVEVFDLGGPAITCPPGIAECLKSIHGNNINPGMASASGGCSDATVSAVRSDGKALSAPYPAGVTTITWTATDSAGNSASCNQFITVLGGKICGVKFYDANANGIQGSSEPGINGYKIVLSGTDSLGNAVSAVQFTANDGSKNGAYCFSNLPMGTYTVSEVFPTSGWIATTGSAFAVEMDQCSVPETGNFGNVCLGAGGGSTLGFWSSKNGETKMKKMPGGMTGTLAYLSSLNLRKVNGSNFDPISYSAFRSWLLAADAANMAYMLSAQMAAMELNVRSGSVASTALIFAPGTNSADSLGFATVASILSEANTELGIHGLAKDGAAWRSYQEALKTALDKANNNLNFIKSSPCSFTSPY